MVRHLHLALHWDAPLKGRLNKGHPAGNGGRDNDPGYSGQLFLRLGPQQEFHSRLLQDGEILGNFILALAVAEDDISPHPFRRQSGGYAGNTGADNEDLLPGKIFL